VLTIAVTVDICRRFELSEQSAQLGCDEFKAPLKEQEARDH